MSMFRAPRVPANWLVITAVLVGTVGLWVVRLQAASFAANPASLGAIADSADAGCGVVPGAAKDVTFTVSGISGAVSSVQVDMTITHTWRGDLDVVLVAPNATSFVLFSHTGSTTATGCGNGNDLAGPYSFVDTAAGNWWTVAGTPTPAGNYRTSSIGGVPAGGALTNMNAAFAGVANANGTWILRIRDYGGGDTGTISAATLILAGAPTPVPVDFDGNRITDWSIVRNTGGGPGGQITWFNENSLGFSTTVWGIATDFFVPADYDGDGKTDPAVWRSGPQGYFYVLNSSTGLFSQTAWGVTGDDPSVTADYDGDGKADPAVFRCVAGQCTFYVKKSTGGNIIQPWGATGTFPAPGDYDGDGKADFGVQANAGGGNAVFHILTAVGVYQAIIWGTPTDVIVPGDYDGDGKTDLAIVRGSGGAIQWWIRRSSDSGLTFISWGLSATDFVTQGDYDGDGKTDAAVWRPSATPGSSLFWVLRSTGGFSVKQWGANGDYPVANWNTH